jgi:molybdopterin synthase sulfur carrier subunit
MPVLVRIPTPLRSLTKGNAQVEASGSTVIDVIADLERQYPGLQDRLVDEGGEIRKFVNVYVNQEDVRFLDGDKTALKDGDEVAIVPAMAGGVQEGS